MCIRDSPWEDQEITVAEFFTEHGLRAKVETVEVPNEDAKLDEEGQPLPGQSKVWARFMFDLDGASETPMPLAEKAEPTAEEGEGADGAAAESTPEPDLAPSVDELARELADLRAKTEGWAYALPSWKSTAFRMGPDAVFEPIPAPEVPEELKPAEDLPGTLLDNVPPPKDSEKDSAKSDGQ